MAESVILFIEDELDHFEAVRDHLEPDFRCARSQALQIETIAKEMGHVLYRMSYSSIIRESQDLGAGLFDRDYNTLCESDSTPMDVPLHPGAERWYREHG